MNARQTREQKAHALIDALAVADEWADKFRHYRTTSEQCDCSDFLFRSRQAGPCKHILALRLLAARELEVAP